MDIYFWSLKGPSHQIRMALKFCDKQALSRTWTAICSIIFKLSLYFYIDDWISYPLNAEIYPMNIFFEERLVRVQAATQFVLSVPWKMLEMNHFALDGG